MNPARNETDWRVPRIGAAFRLGTAGPIVVVLRESGYECENVRVAIFDRLAPSRIVDEPDYYYCQS